MRNDGSSIVGAAPDYLRLAEEAISEIGASSCPQAWKDSLLHGDYGDALSRMRLYAQFLGAGRALLPSQCPEDRGADAFDFRIEAGGEACWVAACTLENELRLLTDNGRSVMIHGSDDYGKQSAAITSESIVGLAHARLSPITVRDAQAVLAIADPMDMVGDYGGLDTAMAEISDEAGWLSAVVLVHAGSCDIRDVRGTTNPLSTPIRGMIMAACGTPTAC